MKKNKFVKLTFKTAVSTHPLYIRPELIAVIEGYSSGTSIVVLRDEVAGDLKKSNQELRSYIVAESPEKIMQMLGE